MRLAIGALVLVAALTSLGAAEPASPDSPNPGPAAGAISSSYDEELPDSAQQVITAMAVCSAIFFLCVGLSVGSFLNVVVYRFPRGMPLTHPPSACPSCGTRIESRDNIPLLGWLRLRGRCRACQARISARYPLVELAVGLVFFVLLYVELLSGGANLPHRPPNQYAGFVWVLWYTKWDLIGIYLFHCTLLTILLALVLIDRDGLPARWRSLRRSLAGWAGLFGLTALILFPGLHPLPFIDPIPQFISRLTWTTPWRDPWSGWEWTVGVSVQGLLSGLVGWAAGHSVGLVAAKTLSFGNAENDSTATVMLGLIGIYLGWQAAILCGIAAIALLLPMRLFARDAQGLRLSTVWATCSLLIVSGRYVEEFVHSVF